MVLVTGKRMMYESMKAIIFQVLIQGLILLFCSGMFLGMVYGQIVPTTPNDEQRPSNSFDFQNRIVDADNALSLARSSIERRDYRQASQLITDAIKIYARHNQKSLVGKSFTMLGFINQEVGNADVADIYFRNALVAYRDGEDFINSGKVAGMLGNIYLRQGSVPKACQSWNIAYEFFRQVGEEFYAEKSFALIREHDCPDAVRYLRPEEAFPDPSASNADARRISILLGEELPEEDFALEAPDAPEENVNFASISREGRGVLDALRVDALTQNAENLIVQAEGENVSIQKQEELLLEAQGIFARLEGSERVSDLQLRLARLARDSNQVEKMQGYYNEAIDTEQSLDRTEGVIEISLELARALKDNNKFEDALTTVVRAENLAERTQSDLYIVALEENANIYLLNNDTENGCRSLTRLVMMIDEDGDALLANQKLLLMAENNCPSPSGRAESSETLTAGEQEILSQNISEISEKILAQKGFGAASQFYLRYANYQINQQNYPLSELSYLAAARFYVEQERLEEVTNAMQSLVSLARLMQDQEKERLYGLQVRTSRLRILHQDKAPVELGNLGINAAQEGDVEIACFFWDWAENEINTAQESNIISVIGSLQTDYRCDERIKGISFN